MQQNFTISSPSVKVILLFFVSIYIILYSFEIVHNVGLSRSVDLVEQQPGSIVLVKGVKYATTYHINQVRIKYIVQGPVEYLLLNSGNNKESLIVLILKLGIGLLGWYFLLKFDFTNPFKPIFFIRSYNIFKLMVALFVFDAIANRYSSYRMEQILYRNNFHYVNSSYSGFWIQTIIALVIMYMYGNAVKNRQELDLTI